MTAWVFVDAGRQAVAGISSSTPAKIFLRDSDALARLVLALDPSDSKKVPIAVTREDGRQRFLMEVKNAISGQNVTDANNRAPDAAAGANYIVLEGDTPGGTVEVDNWFSNPGGGDYKVWAACVVSAASLKLLAGEAGVSLIPVAGRSLNLGSEESRWIVVHAGSVNVGGNKIQKVGGRYVIGAGGGEDDTIANKKYVDDNVTGHNPKGVFGVTLNAPPSSQAPLLRGESTGDLVWVIDGGDGNTGDIVFAATHRKFLQQLIYGADPTTHDNNFGNGGGYEDMKILSEVSAGMIILSAVRRGSGLSLGDIHTRLEGIRADSGEWGNVGRASALVGGSVAAEFLIGRTARLQDLEAGIGNRRARIRAVATGGNDSEDRYEIEAGGLIVARRGILIPSDVNVGDNNRGGAMIALDPEIAGQGVDSTDEDELTAALGAIRVVIPADLNNAIPDKPADDATGVAAIDRAKKRLVDAARVRDDIAALRNEIEMVVYRNGKPPAPSGSPLTWADATAGAFLGQRWIDSSTGDEFVWVKTSNLDRDTEQRAGRNYDEEIKKLANARWLQVRGSVKIWDSASSTAGTLDNIGSDNIHYVKSANADREWEFGDFARLYFHSEEGAGLQSRQDQSSPVVIVSSVFIGGEKIFTAADVNTLLMSYASASGFTTFREGDLALTKIFGEF